MGIPLTPSSTSLRYEVGYLLRLCIYVQVVRASFAVLPEMALYKYSIVLHGITLGL